MTRWFDVAPDPDQRPPLRLLVAEGRVARDWARARWKPRATEREAVGNNAPVMTLPGFCAGDLSMTQMRHDLRRAGFRARGWHMGPNLGARPDTLERIHARVASIADREGRAVHLLGWSLGGVFAREYAKSHPDHVASVISMGSPFSGDLHANNAWRLYRIVAGHSVDAPPVALRRGDKPPVPTFALWSAKDGVISAHSARGLASESDVQIEMPCGHLGFAFDPAVTDVVIQCMLSADQHQSMAAV